MNPKQLEQLRSFERMVASKVIKFYGGYLTTEAKEELMKQSLITNEYYNHFTSPENIQGEMVRLVFSKVFEKIPCTKGIKFSDNQKRNIKYGIDIFHGLIAYYSKELSEKTNIKIDEIPAYKNDYDKIIKIKEKLGVVFETMVFNCDALTILNAASLEEITKECDKNAVINYIKESKNESTQTNNISKTKKIFPLVYLSENQYLKVINEDGTKQMIKMQNPSLVSKTYKDLLNKKKDEDLILAEDILQALTKIGETIPFYTKKVEPNSKLSSSEKDLLDTFYGKKDELFNEEKVEIPNETNKLTTPNKQKNNVKLITEEEYEKLCMKSVNNKKLTDEELEQMEYFDIYYFGNGNEITNNDKIVVNQIPKQNTGIKPKQTFYKEAKQGYAQKYTPLFALLIVILLGIVFGFIIFKVLR